MSDYTNLSKFLSMILRHKPEVIKIKLDKHGWANVDELISNMWKYKQKYIDRGILEHIVKTDEKQRYSFNEDKTLIRANQGHSIKVDVELEEKEPPEILYHGTATKFVKGIEQEGLKKQSRLYVHLSKDIDTAIKVGSRHGKPIVYKVKAKEMFNDGFKFFISENKVWLTDHVPVKYLEEVFNE